jgi:hypothetical protein
VLRLGAIALSLLAVVATGCGGSSASRTSAPADAPKTQAAAAAEPAVCPAAWRAGWAKLAQEVKAPVYCPSWLPDPLRGHIGGLGSARYVNPDRSYLIAFFWLDTTPTGGEEVHVNLRGYPGRASIPVCEDTVTANGKITHPKLPCFDDPRGTKRFGSTKVTVYTANQGADQWHVLYAWHRRGSLYTLSEHVAPPFTYAGVIANLDRMMRGLVLVRPVPA